MKIRHILLTTDLSQEAVRAFVPITALARELGARITLLHVVPDLTVTPHGAPMAPRQSAPDLPEQVHDARQELERQRTLLGVGAEATVEVITGDDVAVAVTDYASKHDVDLVALSTHGRTGFRHLVLGSVAEAILRHSTVPVLCVPRSH